MRHLVERLSGRVHAPKANRQHEFQPVGVSFTHRLSVYSGEKQSPILHPFGLACKLPLSTAWITIQIRPKRRFSPVLAGTSRLPLTFSYKLKSIFRGFLTNE